MKIVKFLIIILLIFFLVIISNYSNIEYNMDINMNKKIINNNKINNSIYKDGFSYYSITDELKAKITGCSYPDKFNDNKYKINYNELRYLKVKHYDFDNNIKDGELIVHYKVAQEVLEIFYILFENKYQIEKISLVENYNCIDELSMEDNNSSAFNYRFVENTNTLSWHAFGLAIDINPLYNPYITDNHIFPLNAKKYVDRSLNIKWYINKDDFCYKIFKKYGWLWGGDFIYNKDYQHFYKEGVINEEYRY